MTDSSRRQMFSSVDAYDRYVGRYSRALARELMARAAVVPGQRVLDVGCGPGALTGELAAVLGSDHVAGIDPSPEFVDACRERYPGVQVEVAVAESIPFDDRAFDAAIAQLVVHFMTDAPAGVEEMKRVTKPGGALAAATWDYKKQMLLLRNFWDAAIAVDGGAAAVEQRNPPYCTPEELGGLWRGAGLLDVEVGAAVVSASYDNFEDLWAPFEVGVGPGGAYTVSLTDDGRAALKTEFQRRLGVGDEPFELTARAWVATGRVA